MDRDVIALEKEVQLCKAEGIGICLDYSEWRNLVENIAFMDQDVMALEKEVQVLKRRDNTNTEQFNSVVIKAK